MQNKPTDQAQSGPGFEYSSAKGDRAIGYESQFHVMTSGAERFASSTFVWPAVLVVLILSVFPLIISIGLSLGRLKFVKGGFAYKFVGLANYRKLLAGSEKNHFLGKFIDPTPLSWFIFGLLAVALIVWLVRYIRNEGLLSTGLFERILVVVTLGLGVWLVTLTYSELIFISLAVMTLAVLRIRYIQNNLRHIFGVVALGLGVWLTTYIGWLIAPIFWPVVVIVVTLFMLLFWVVIVESGKFSLDIVFWHIWAAVVVCTVASFILLCPSIFFAVVVCTVASFIDYTGLVVLNFILVGIVAQFLLGGLFWRIVTVIVLGALAWMVVHTIGPGGGRPGTLTITMIYVFVGIFIQYILGLGLAMLLTQQLPGRRFFRVIFLLPMMITPVGVAYMFRMLTDTDKGPFQPIWQMLGLGLYSWVTNPWGARVAVMIGDVWQWTPFIFIVLLAALEGQSIEPFEAAVVDGANRWQIFRYVTLPEILPVSLTVILIRMIEAFKIMDLPNVLTNGGPGTATESLTLQSFFTWRAVDLGGSAAIAYMLLFVATFFGLAYVNLIRQRAVETL